MNLRQFIVAVVVATLLSTAAFSFQNTNCAMNAPAPSANITAVNDGAMANPLQFTPEVVSTSAGGEPAVVAMIMASNNPNTNCARTCTVAQRSMPLKFPMTSTLKGSAAQTG